MTRVGAEMDNPVTRERFVWRATAASTGGEYVEVDLHLAPGALLAARHVHPEQREDFRVVRGALALECGGVHERLGPGDARTVAPGVPHEWGQAGPEETVVTVRLTPALRIEDFFETFCGLARDGKVTKKGMPRHPLQAAVLAHAFRRELTLPSRAQRVVAGPVFAVLAAVGRALGYRPRYEKYASG